MAYEIKNSNILRNSRLPYFFIIAIFISLFLLVYFLNINESQLSNFRFTQYLFNYQSGFNKRGFVGEVLFQFGFVINYENVQIFANYCMAVLSIVFFAVIYYPFKDDIRSFGACIFVFLAFFGSFSMQHFWSDIGRFDHLQLIIAISLLLLLSFSVNIFSKIIVVASVVIIILIHEGGLFMYAPLVLSFWLYKSEEPKEKLFIVLLFSCLVFLGYIISTEAIYYDMSFYEHVLSLESKYGGRVSELAVSILHNGSIRDNFLLTVRNGFSSERLYESIKVALFVSPLMLVFFRIIRADVKNKNVRLKHVFILSAFSPLLIYPIGYDHFRWWSISLTNLFVATSFVAANDEKFKILLIYYFNKSKITLASLIACSVAFGGMGVTNAFQRF
ncbi:hypothetical protein DFR26_1427 [Paraperlucidibaca baekdonensis]|uniref:Uncharacterized protein n=1 Tax=Paraperlucidibaca baekdonensis TaxID=748120 RepID=A0A3E0H2V5_9GAMM|nr:hypothetical protein [Paraperlucidibaca baekdonensis]REH37648.1 hypothetical protein DFR26_1427 [Paraperlucidibaca baekdonensis]